MFPGDLGLGAEAIYNESGKVLSSDAAQAVGGRGLLRWPSLQGQVVSWAAGEYGFLNDQK